MLSVTTIPSPIGELTIGVSDRGVRFLSWNDDPRPQPTEDVQGGPPSRRAQILAQAIAQLEEYFAGTRMDFDLPLDPVGTPFQQSAWQVLRTIPYGSTVSYGDQARKLGDPNKARAVGAANGKNPIGIIVPCHRVVGANGSLTGFAGGLDSKAWLLDHERRVVATN
jgi:methylated-DNA-[protein]-cysteine S-methyltransferase